jgi:periplasmic protein TonB
MGSLIRLLFGAPIAAAVTIALFLMMAALVYVEKIKLNEDGEAISINLNRKISDTKNARATEKFERPKLEAPPPPPPAINNSDFKPELGAVAVAAPNFDAKVDLGTGFNPDRDAQPLVRIPPDYPDRCKSDKGGTETVEVEFDVTPDGQVTNAKVVSSTDTCLNRSSIRAVLRWKYQPKVVDGEAKPRFGVRTTLSYRLED